MNDYYDPVQYWEDRGQDYTGGESPSEYAYMCWMVDQYTTPGDNLCEVGSGYGRVLTELERYWTGRYNCGFLYSRALDMFDIVDSMRAQCLTRTLKPVFKWNGLSLPVVDNVYDFVLSTSVLLHVTPDCIERVLAEHVRVCKQYLYVATYSGSGPCSAHCFVHDYSRLFDLNGLRVIERKEFGPDRICWLLEV